MRTEEIQPVNCPGILSDKEIVDHFNLLVTQINNSLVPQIKVNFKILDLLANGELDTSALIVDGSNQSSWTPTTTVVTNLNADLLDGNHASAFETAFSSGTSADYFRGDKTWVTLNQSVISGLTTSDTPTFLGITANGKYIGKITSVSSGYTVLTTDSTITCNSSTAITLTLPAAVTGQIFNIKNIGAGVVTVDGYGSDTIDGETSQDIAQWECIVIQCISSNTWSII